MMKNARFAQRLCSLFLLLALMGAIAPAQAASGDMYMYIETGNSGRLHLRARPDAGSESLGLFRNGTPVLIEGFANGSWASVVVSGQRGYMNLNFLSGYAPAAPAVTVKEPDATEYTLLYVQTGNSGRLHLRAYASQNADSLGLYANGTPVYVTTRANGWAFVHIGEARGYMMLRYLADTPYAQPAYTQPTAAQPVPATPVQTSGSTLLYVRTGNSGKLHLREYASQSARSLGLYPNGTPVYAVTLNNGWSQVVVGGQAGYMMTRYLSPTAGSYPTQTASQPAPAYTPVYTYPTNVANGAVVRNPNSSFVYLRSTRNTDSTANVLAQVPNGAAVQLLQADQYWCKVVYNGVEGYMVASYLK